MNTIKIFIAIALIGCMTSCGYKKSVGDKVYVQFVGTSGTRIAVAHSNPDCPEIDSYKEEPLKDCFAVTVCAKCVKNEDVSKILKN